MALKDLPRGGRLCVIVVSHNYKELTDQLCESIRRNTKRVDYDLHVVETGSDFTKCSQYASVWVKEKCRMTRGWNIAKQAADVLHAGSHGLRYSAYQLFVNDAHFLGPEDMISTLFEEMMQLEDCGQIHPYQLTVGEHGKTLRKMDSGVRRTSFSEIICPMIRAEAWDQCGEDFLDNRFYYGWGLDYDMPHQLFKHNWRCYISDDVGVLHQMGTTLLNSQVTGDTITMPAFSSAARDSMYAGMLDKYGADWYQVILDSIPSDTPRAAMEDWMLFAEAEYIQARKGGG